MRTMMLGIVTCLVGAGLALAQTAPPAPAKPAATPAPEASKKTDAQPPAPAKTTAGPLTTVAAPTHFAVQAPSGDYGAHSAVPPWHFWANIEYLFWWTKDDQAPILVTEGPPTQPPGVVGSLGDGSTVPLFTGDLRQDPYSGLRAFAGLWLDRERSWGVEAGGFWLGDREDPVHFGNEGLNPTITRPFRNAATDTETAAIVALPGLAAGRLVIFNPHELWGLEGNVVRNLSYGCRHRIDFVAGLRYLDLKESLRIHTDTRFTVAEDVIPGLAGSFFISEDRFGARNQFYAGQIGIDGQVGADDWYIAARGKLAMGCNHEKLDIRGVQRFTTPGGVSTIAPVGTLVLPSNTGDFTRNDFAVLPEFSIDFGLALSQCVQVYAGYTILYLSEAVRPGEQIDRVIDQRQLIPGAPSTGRPAPLFKSTDYWAQGIHVGFGFNW